MNSDRSLNKGMKSYFDRCASTWDEDCDIGKEKIAAVVTLAGICSGSRVADIACGTGVLFKEMLSRNPKEIVGIDLSDQMIARAREKFNDQRLRLIVSDLFEFRETGFDAVTIFSAYPHFLDKRRLAEHLSFLLKSGGRFMAAHCESRAGVNSHHMGEQVKRLSAELRPVREEAAEFEPFFSVDMLIDSNDFYLFSGVKR